MSQWRGGRCGPDRGRAFDQKRPVAAKVRGKFHAAVVTAFGGGVEAQPVVERIEFLHELSADEWFQRAGIAAVGIDGLKFNCAKSVYPLVQADLSHRAVYCPVDLVLCVEMVEHLEEKYLDNLLDTLCNGKIIVMTNALPGQGGYHHVNEQPTKYWIDQFAKRNCTVSKDDTEKIQSLAKAEGADHIARTGMVLINHARNK